MLDSPDSHAFNQAMADDLAAYDAELIATEGPNALTSDRAARLIEFRATQVVEREAAIRRAEQDADLLGSMLATFRRRRGWAREQLADWLGVSVEDFGRLAVEKRPRAVNQMTMLYDPDSIDALADRHGAHRERLYEAVDQGDQ